MREPRTYSHLEIVLKANIHKLMAIHANTRENLSNDQQLEAQPIGITVSKKYILSNLNPNHKLEAVEMLT